MKLDIHNFHLSKKFLSEIRIFQSIIVRSQSSIFLITLHTHTHAHTHTHPTHRSNNLISTYSYLGWRRQWHPTPGLLPGKSHGRRSLEDCSPWGRWGSDTTEQLHFHFWLACIGEGNGNPLQCSCLENPRDLWAWWVAVYGSHRVGHEWSDLAAS